jgi:quaternary ammonium compound-resistance protein SugE
MAWYWLVIAGIFEVVWAVAMKYSSGFTKPVPSVITFLGMILSFYFLALALRSLPLGTAYTVWTGIGAIGTVILGMVLFGEPQTSLRLFLIGLIFVGIVGLKLTS